MAELSGQSKVRKLSYQETETKHRKVIKNSYFVYNHLSGATSVQNDYDKQNVPSIVYIHTHKKNSAILSIDRIMGKSHFELASIWNMQVSELSVSFTEKLTLVTTVNSTNKTPSTTCNACLYVYVCALVMNMIKNNICYGWLILLSNFWRRQLDLWGRKKKKNREKNIYWSIR